MAGDKCQAETPQVLELRVHGVQDHPDFSALGSPEIEQSTSTMRLKTRTVVVTATPSHTLWLLNWSRTARRLTGLLWYLAMPFTLLNVAGQTGHPPSPKSGKLRADARGPNRDAKADPVVTVVTALAGLILTASAFVWTIAIAETAVRYFVLDGPETMAKTILAVVAFLWIATLVVRPLQICHSHASPSCRRLLLLALANILVVASLAAWMWAARPARIPIGSVWRDLPFSSTSAPVDPDDPASPCYSAADVNGCYARHSKAPQRVDYIDVLNVSIVAGLIASMLLAFCIVIYAIVLHTVRHGKSDAKRSSASLASCALLIVASFSILTTFGSLLRQATDWLLFLADQFEFFTRVEGDLSPHAYANVLPYELARSALSLADGFPLFAVAGLVLLVFSLLAVGRLVFRVSYLVASGFVSSFKFGTQILLTGSSQNGRKEQLRADRQRAAVARKRRLMVHAHGLIGGLDRHLLPAVCIAALLWVAVWVASVSAWPPRFATGVSNLLIVLSALLAILTIVVIFARGHFQGVRKTFDLIADIAGFWRPEWHPVCGASYRNTVVDGIRSDIKDHRFENVILVGHSQGSVLCLWYVTDLKDCVADPPVGERRIDLVTCGSPIASIYQLIFPRHFSESRLKCALRRVNTWTNFWRATDPIASRIYSGAEGLEIDNQELTDARPDLMFGHSDYWKDEVLVKHVNDLVEARAGSETGPPSA